MNEIECDIHGKSQETYICEHLVTNPSQQWFGSLPTDANPWPDVWCAKCNEAFAREGEWNDSNPVPIKLLCHACYESARLNWLPSMPDAELEAWRNFVRDSFEEWSPKHRSAIEAFCLDKHPRWDWDQERAEIVFSDFDGPVVVANIEFVGTTSAATGTWLWAWSNQDLLPQVKSKISSVQALGIERNFPHLALPKWKADAVDGWEMTAVAGKILGCDCGYRTTRDEGGYTYLLLQGLRWVERNH